MLTLELGITRGKLLELEGAPDISFIIVFNLVGLVTGVVLVTLELEGRDIRFRSRNEYLD